MDCKFDYWQLIKPTAANCVMTFITALSVFFAANVTANTASGVDLPQSQSEIVTDELRLRGIPIELYHPAQRFACSNDKKCPVMLINSGYGLLHTDYQFISQWFQQQGYFVLAIRHELPSDPDLSRTPPYLKTRAENWQRGANTVDFIQQRSRQLMPQYDFDHVTLVGHSNGGDISAWLATHGVTDSADKNVKSPHYVDYIERIITLDHRRVPLPRNVPIEVLSIRASDYPADEGVLPDENEHVSNISVVTINESRHNDMNDYGPQWLKDEIINIISEQMNF